VPYKDADYALRVLRRIHANPRAMHLTEVYE
jgi:hypothetical protein